VIKSRKMIWTGQLRCNGGEGNAYKGLVEKPRRKYTTWKI
jgi:hypothetical protein